MPTQEDKAVTRIKATSQLIQDAGKISLKEMEAWARISYGIRPKTLASYVIALNDMGIVKYDYDTKMVTWIEQKQPSHAKTES